MNLYALESYLGVADFLETLEHVEYSSLNLFLG